MISRERRIPRELWKPILEGSKGRPGYFNTTYFTLRISPSDDERVRVAVSVSKKVSKKAVVRNRVRRRAYAVLGRLIPSMKKNLYMLSAKPGAEGLKGEALEEEVKKLLANFLLE